MSTGKTILDSTLDLAELQTIARELKALAADNLSRQAALSEIETAFAVSQGRAAIIAGTFHPKLKAASDTLTNLILATSQTADSTLSQLEQLDHDLTETVGSLAESLGEFGV